MITIMMIRSVVVLISSSYPFALTLLRFAWHGLSHVAHRTKTAPDEVALGWSMGAITGCGMFGRRSLMASNARYTTHIGTPLRGSRDHRAWKSGRCSAGFPSEIRRLRKGVHLRNCGLNPKAGEQYRAAP